MIRVVLDTNVIVSALVFGGIPRRILELAQSKEYDWFYSEPIQEEVERILRVKFGWPQEKLNEVRAQLWIFGEFIAPNIKIQAVIDDPDDDRVLECAVSSGADIVVSGDRHLLALGNHKTVSIVSPRQFAEIAGIYAPPRS
jgi:uncharacterized protein